MGASRSRQVEIVEWRMFMVGLAYWIFGSWVRECEGERCKGR